MAREGYHHVPKDRPGVPARRRAPLASPPSSSGSHQGARGGGLQRAVDPALRCETASPSPPGISCPQTCSYLNEAKTNWEHAWRAANQTPVTLIRTSTLARHVWAVVESMVGPAGFEPAT